MRGLGCYIPEDGDTFLETYERREADRDVDAEIDELKERIEHDD